MESYDLRIKPSAAKELEGIDSKKDRQELGDLITTLAKHPRPRGSLKLTGREGYRVRHGFYRILYEIDDDKRIVTIFKIAHRRDVYR